MQRHRPVPGLARGSQQFSRDALPPIQSPMGMMPTQQTPPVAADDPADDLAQEIFARLAVNHLMHNPAAPDSRILRDLAQSAQFAARAFFEEPTA
jgi:hypothetical protein